MLIQKKHFICACLMISVIAGSFFAHNLLKQKQVDASQLIPCNVGEFAANMGDGLYTYKDGVLTRVVEGDMLDVADWSPDGRYLAYSLLENDSSHIYSFDTTTRKSAQLTFGEHFDFAPVWSPDGEYLAYVRSYSDDTEKAQDEELHIINLTNHSELVPDVRIISNPSWHPTQNILLFSAQTKESVDVFIYSVASKQIISISPSPFDDVSPRFSASGESIAYYARGNTYFVLYDENTLNFWVNKHVDWFANGTFYNLDNGTAYILNSGQIMEFEGGTGVEWSQKTAYISNYPNGQFLDLETNKICMANPEIAGVEFRPKG